MARLNLEALKKVDDAQYDIVDIPEWGGEIKLKTISLEDQLEFGKLLQESNGDEYNYVFYLLKASCLNDEDKPMFTSIEDVALLKNMATAPVMKLFKAALALNDISDKEVEAVAKN